MLGGHPQHQPQRRLPRPQRDQTLGDPQAQGQQPRPSEAFEQPRPVPPPQPQGRQSLLSEDMRTFLFVLCVVVIFYTIAAVLWMPKQFGEVGLLAGYSYEEYLAEWRHLFGDELRGSVDYEDEQSRARRLPLYQLGEEQFYWVRDVVVKDNSDPNRALVAELVLLM